MSKKIILLQEEYWYGGKVEDGVKMPLDCNSNYTCDLCNLNTNNQAAPLFLSSKGRYIYSKSAFIFMIKDGVITIENKCDLLFGQSGECLRDAYNAVQKIINYQKEMPQTIFFEVPQYNLWIELLNNQNQSDILDYAKNVLKNGLPSGILMVDDGWATNNGEFEWNYKKFPEPKKMVEQLRSMGFKIMLWVSPFITPDTPSYRKLRDDGLLIKSNGAPYLVDWWNGFSACLDMSNPKSVAYLDNKLGYLINEFGVDGFKFDAGDAYFYTQGLEYFDTTCSGNKQCELWAEYGKKYAYNEYRACFNQSGSNLIQRLADKFHTWQNDGIKSLVPNTLQASILGYRYCCPDMIGGGDYRSFPPVSTTFSQELFVRYCQCATLMPMMQFSLAPWRVLNSANMDIVKQCVKTHIDFRDIFISQLKKAALSGEPMIASMEFYYPNQGYQKIIDQFMIGENILVAPVLQQGQKKKDIILPSGEWKYNDKIYSSGSVTIKVDDDTLPLFMRY